MGIYWFAVDCDEKEVIYPPREFSNTTPGLFHPENPFPGMVIMKNCYGSSFEVQNDMGYLYETDEFHREYKDITDETYKEYTEKFK